MSKKPSKRLRKALEIDVDALLRSDESGKENSQPSIFKQQSSRGKRQEKVKPVSKSPLEDEKDTVESVKYDEDTDLNLFDMAKSVENFKKDISKPVKSKKVLLEQFTHEVSEIYKTKTIELRKKQLSEEKELKASFLSEIDKELQKRKEDINKIMEQEEKIVQMLQQHMKIMQRATTSVSTRKTNLLQIAKNFEEQREELMKKHEHESSTAMESVQKEVIELQTKFLADVQKEEMASLKKLFCSNVFF